MPENDAHSQLELPLPPGVKLLRTLEGHKDAVTSLTFDAAGGILASGSADKTINLWEVHSGKLLRTLEGPWDSPWSIAFESADDTLASGAGNTIKLWEVHSGKQLRTLGEHRHRIWSVAFNAAGSVLASGSQSSIVKLWEVRSGKLLHILDGHQDPVFSVALNATGDILASGSADNTIKLWEVHSGKLLSTLEGHQSTVYSVAFDATGNILASGSADNTVRVWEVRSGKLLRTVEGHTGMVEAIAFFHQERLLASKGQDRTVRLWRRDTWEPVTVIPEWTSPIRWLPALAFHPTLPLLATGGSAPGTSKKERGRLIHIWELDLGKLLGQPAAPSANYTSAKIVLVGESGVGKTGLGWRLAHDEYKQHASTHGQQFWPLGQLSQTRRDGAQCEAVLWDLAGQPDYRLIHALFLDDADLALLLFDPTRSDDPLREVEFWLKQLHVRGAQGEGAACGPPTVLVAARSDRGSARLTNDELAAFCRQRGLRGYISTSALRGEGIEELMRRMQELIPWDDKPATVTTLTFKRIKDFVLELKEDSRRQQVILTPQELRKRLQATDAGWRFTDDEMLTAFGHLVNHGYVTKLKTSQGEERLLLAPELLNNLAASFVLEARRNEKGLGALEEQRLLSQGYRFPELDGLSPAERDVLLDSAVALFLEHNVCFRETDPLTTRAYLVFPELINLKKPLLDDEPAVEDGVAYTVSGAVENVYASLVVLLGYTHTFTRTNQWRHHARYEVGDKLVCGFRLEDEREGELDFVLYFGVTVGDPVRTLFQSLFENFLARRNLTVLRFEPVVCSKGHQLNRAVMREQLASGADFAFCAKCGERLSLPRADKPIQLTKKQAADVEAQRRVADQRSRFEQAIFRLKSYVTEEGMTVPECFISYAWGDAVHERWVERLAEDLAKAGLAVVLDKWENQRIGASILRFIERIDECNFMIVVGTPLYRQKAKNVASETGSVVAAEYDLAGIRLLGTEGQKQEVLPILLDGEPATALPPLLRGKVHADFRQKETYFVTAFDLILSLYDIPPRHKVGSDLRESLHGRLR